MIAKNKLSLTNENILVNSEDNCQSPSIFEFPRWNINFLEWTIRLLFRWNSEYFANGNTMQESCRKVILEIHEI